MKTNIKTMKEIGESIKEATAAVRSDPTLENVSTLRRVCMDASARCDRMHRDYARVDCALNEARNAMGELGRALFTSASDVDYTP